MKFLSPLFLFVGAEEKIPTCRLIEGCATALVSTICAAYIFFLQKRYGQNKILCRLGHYKDIFFVFIPVCSVLWDSNLSPAMLMSYLSGKQLKIPKRGAPLRQI